MLCNHIFQIAQSSEPPTIPGHLSISLQKLMSACLQLNPILRPTAKEILTKFDVF